MTALTAARTVSQRTITDDSSPFFSLINFLSQTQTQTYFLFLYFLLTTTHYVHPRREGMCRVFIIGSVITHRKMKSRFIIFGIFLCIIIFFSLNENSPYNGTDKELIQDDNIRVYNFTYIVKIKSLKPSNVVTYRQVYFDQNSLYHTIINSQNNFNEDLITDIYKDINNNTIFFFELEMDDDQVITMKQTHTIKYKSEINFNKSLLSTDYMYEEHLESDYLIESKEENIINKAIQITENISNDYEKCVAINNWINTNLEYTDYNPTSLGALYALNNLKGDCSEYSHLFVALCRSQGIPSRQVDGLSNIDITNHIQDWNSIGHDWAEVYFIDYGWIWFDPTTGWNGNTSCSYLSLQHGTLENSAYYRNIWNPNTIIVDEEFIFYLIN